MRAAFGLRVFGLCPTSQSKVQKQFVQTRAVRLALRSGTPEMVRPEFDYVGPVDLGGHCLHGQQIGKQPICTSHRIGELSV